MTIQETIDELNTVPVDRRGEKLRIYVQGRISGFLDAQSIDVMDDKDYISVVADLTFRMED